jgi:hypothetical protein
MLSWFALIILPALLHAEEQPKLQFDRTVYDFGTTSLVRSVSARIQFRNQGTGVLELGKPTTDCGCTVASLKPERLQPGEAGELLFSVSLSTAPQKIQKHVFLPSNDPSNRLATLVIKVEVTRVANVTPPALSIGEIRLGSETNGFVTIHRVDGKKLKIARFASSGDFLRASVDSIELDGEAARVRVGVNGQGAPRQFNELISVFSEDSGTAPVAEFTVNGRLAGDVQIEPAALSWSIPDTKKYTGGKFDVVREQAVMVTSQTDQPLEVRNLTCDLPEVRVRLRTLTPFAVYQILVRAPRRINGSKQGKIRFETNLSSLPKVELPVSLNAMKDE